LSVELSTITNMLAARLYAAAVLSIAVQSVTLGQPQVDNVSESRTPSIDFRTNVYQFDLLPVQSGPVLPPIPPQDGRMYQPNFRYVTIGGALGIATGIIPESGKNVAIFYLPATGNLTTENKCIVLQEFYAACTTTNLQPNANVNLGCLITVSAYGTKGEFITSQEFKFTPDNLVLSKMDKFVSTLPPAKTYGFVASILPEFLGNIGSGLTAGLADNVKTIQYNDAGKCGRGF
jgi:hypothetical protein